MARDRAGKVGIDYFSHDVDMSLDIKIKLLKAKHGLIGYAVYLLLLEELYGEKGYYLQLSEDFNILFCNDNNLDYNVYILILNDCILRKLFNKVLYDKYNILTSERIQLNYISATERRKDVSFFEEYLLVDVKEKYEGKIANVYILTLNDDICKQREREREKERKRKEKETLPCPHQDIMELYNSLCISLPKIKEVTDKRQDTLRVWWRSGITIDNIKTFFEKVERSDFLTGKTGNFNGCSFDWIIKPANRQKILEGNYDAKNKSSNGKGRFIKRLDELEANGQ